MPTVSDYLQQPQSGLVAVNVGSWVQLLNNVTAATFVSSAATDATGKFTVNNVPAGSYTVKTGPASGGPFTSTGDTNYLVTADLRWFSVRDYGALGDGSNDDSTAINAAITAAAGGGIVFFPPGTYRCAASVTLSADNIILMGCGASSIIKAANSLNADLVKTPTAATSIRNFCGITNLQLDGNRANQSSGHVVHFYGTRYCFLDRCKIVNAFDHALSLDGDGTGFGFNNSITNNVFDTCNGIITDQFNEAAYLANNQLKSCDSPGHMCNLTSGGHMLVGNVFGASGTYTTPALELANSLPIKVVANRFDTCRHQAVKCNSGNHVIVGNEMFKCCAATSNTESVVHIGANTGTLVVGNRVYSDSAATWQYAVQMDGGGNNNLVATNILLAGLTGTVNPAGANSVVANNIGYNPQGVAAITVTASPFTYTNNDSVPETVYISGGTVSAVAKNSITVYATTNVGVFLMPGEAVTVTYSSVPTMNKDRK